jgi:6-phosphogluconolactonase (cycloisomerase 2 family)
VRAVKELLQGADRHGKDNITGDLEHLVHEGRSLWVCERCSADIRNGRVVDETRNMKWSQYISLVKREPRNEVTRIQSRS